MQKILLIFGALVIAIGLLWPILSRIPFGKLPLDFIINIGGTQLFIPFGTCILISIFLTLLLSCSGNEIRYLA